MTKIRNFFLYFIANLITAIISFYILYLIFSIFNIKEDIPFKISVHAPLLIQVFYTGICFYKWKHNFIKSIFVSTIIFTIISIFYNLNFTNSYYLDDYLPYLVVEEIIFQIYLVILISIFVILKKIKKRYIIYNFMILIPIPFSLEVWLLYIFNPVLIFILTSIIDGDLLIEDKKENIENS